MIMWCTFNNQPVSIRFIRFHTHICTQFSKQCRNISVHQQKRSQHRASVCPFLEDVVSDRQQTLTRFKMLNLTWPEWICCLTLWVKLPVGTRVHSFWNTNQNRPSNLYVPCDTCALSHGFRDSPRTFAGAFFHRLPGELWWTGHPWQRAKGMGFGQPPWICLATLLMATKLEQIKGGNLAARGVRDITGLSREFSSSSGNWRNTSMISSAMELRWPGHIDATSRRAVDQWTSEAINGEMWVKISLNTLCL